jgi:hypothetical protein
MQPMNLHLQFLLVMLAGWVNRHQQTVIEYLRAENQALREQLGKGRERHLRHLLAEYVTHYHAERNHQGLANRLVEPPVANTNSGEGVVRRRERVGGLLSYYFRDAA